MDHKKNNIFDYLDWRGDLSFRQNELNEIDALILTALSYLDLSGIGENEILSFKEINEHVKKLPAEQKLNGALMIMPDVVKLAEAASKTLRFGEMNVTNYVNILDEERELQFSAVTFLLPDRTAFLAFRGTDNTLVGWKEDFNMSFLTDGVPAQLEAAKYASSAAEKIDLPLRFGGHSKGGNLAVWAGACLPVQYKDRLLAIYNNDGPGFSENFLSGAIYMSIREKIYSFVPESSIVGVLMEHDNYTTISSSNPSLLQHDPFSWMLKGTHFLTKNTRSLTGRHFDKAINAWIRSMSAKEREEFIEILYKVLTSSNAKTVNDLYNLDFKALAIMDKTFRELSSQKQTQFRQNMARLFTSKGDKEK